MTYPTLNPDAVIAFVKMIRDLRGAVSQQQIESFSSAAMVGVSDWDVDLDPIARAAADLESDLSNLSGTTTEALEQLEGEHCGSVFLAIDRIPVEVLDDSAFWSYIAVRHFTPFILAREHRSLNALVEKAERRGDQTEPPLPLRRYFDGADVYQIPLRMYVRAQAIRQGDDFSLAAAVPSGTDFWRSHVVRVSTSYYPALSRALAKKQVEARLTTEPLRAAVRRINRYRVNMHPAVLDERDHEEVVDALWPDA